MGSASSTKPMGVLLGQGDAGPVELDIELLLRTRLLIQASSGGGKSWLLRRLAEQLFGKVQVIILDPEGEFATLREQFGYVLVGKGGETPADTRSAALVAQRLLELNASAVCDLFEMKPEQRHAWVRLFLDALIDAPKRLWRPLVVIVDEAHVFAPEKGAGDSEAKDAVIALATRGRKRGFAAVLATQRLAKLRKDVAAECGNVLIGRTMLDVDRDRAVDALGIGGSKGDRVAFASEIKLLRPGGFYALGPALCDTRTLLRVGPVDTSHHEPGSSRHAAEPPPPPARVKALLPQLADLPKEAEAKAQTETELRRQIAALQRELAAAQRATPAPEVRTVEISVVPDEVILRAEGMLAGGLERLGEAIRALRSTEEHLGALRTAIERAKAPSAAPRPNVAPAAPVRQTHAGAAPARRANNGSSAGLTGPEQRIVDAIAWLNSIGVADPEQVAVAFLAGYTYGGGAFNNPRGALRTKGLVEYAGDRIRLTAAGRGAAQAPDAPLSTEELHARVLERLPGPEQRLLRPLLAAYPRAMSNEDLAAAAGYTPGAGAYNNPRGRLRSLGLVDYPAPGQVIARAILFV